MEGELPGSEGLGAQELLVQTPVWPQSSSAASPGGTHSESLIIDLFLEATEPVDSWLNEASVAHTGMEKATLTFVFSSSKAEGFQVQA